jgi:hypothetical protein
LGCFQIIFLLVGFVLMMVTFIRWFEQTAEAVDNRWWSKLQLLLICPFVVWFYPSRVGTGRASPVPHHEPVRGFGSMPKAKPPATPDDQPPPGTPKEFLGLPKIPPPRPKAKSSVDPDKVAQLKEKMRRQGMLPPEGE